MNAITTFAHELFGEIRITDRNGAPWFVAKDVALALGYADPKKAVNQHCNLGVTVSPPSSSKTHGGLRSIKIIPEPDLYRLVMRSKLPEAERFQDWVYEEVLPTIRKTGSYATPGANTLEGSIQELSSEIRALKDVLRGLNVHPGTEAASALPQTAHAEAGFISLSQRDKDEAQQLVDAVTEGHAQSFTVGFTRIVIAGSNLGLDKFPKLSLPARGRKPLVTPAQGSQPGKRVKHLIHGKRFISHGFSWDIVQATGTRGSSYRFFRVEG